MRRSFFEAGKSGGRRLLVELGGAASALLLALATGAAEGFGVEPPGGTSAFDLFGAILGQTGLIQNGYGRLVKLWH